MIDDDIPPQMSLAGDHDFEEWHAQSAHERLALVELVNRVLDKGVVVTGEVTIAVGGVELLFLGLQVVLSSVQSLVNSGHVRSNNFQPPPRRP